VRGIGETESEVVDPARTSRGGATFERDHVVRAGDAHLDRVGAAVVFAHAEQRTVERE
jgi:hypothetical protein